MSETKKRGLRWIPAALLLTLAAVLGFGTLPDYGISWDEANHIREVRELVDSITEGSGVSESSGHYGQLFNLIGEAAFRVTSRVHVIDPEEERRSPYRRTVVRHVLTLLTSLLTIALVCAIGHSLAGPPFGALAGAVLLLMPRYWGHSFYNAKDIPFAAAFTLAALAAPLLVRRILAAERLPARLTSFALFGVLVGFGSATRLGLAACLALLPVLLFVMSPDRDRRIRNTARLLSIGLPITGAAWLATTIALHPASYSNPIAWLQSALTYFSHHPFDAPVLFEGEVYPANELPRRYVVTYLWRTTPVLWFLLGMGGILAAIVRWRSFDPLRRGLVVALLFQIVALPAYAFVKHATVYDGVRQFLFMLPALAAFATYGIVSLHRPAGMKARVVLWSLLGLYGFSVAREMHTLHPYEATYFHEPIGGIAGAADDFELDYWGLSMRACAEHVSSVADSGDGVVLGGNPAGTRAFLNWNLRPLYWEDYRDGRGEGDYRYYIGLRRTDLFDQYPASPVVYAVTRKGVVLCHVKELAPEEKIVQRGARQSAVPATPDVPE